MLGEALEFQLVLGFSQAGLHRLRTDLVLKHLGKGC